MEEKLKRSDERFRLGFTHAAIGKGIVAPDHRILQVNPSVCRILGYTDAELLSLDTAAITHPDDRANTDELSRGLLEGRQVSASLEKRFLHKDGRIIWGLLTATLVRDPEGKALYFIEEVEDITERKKTEE